MSINKTRVCIFGTSANPPTNAGGHAGIVSSLASLRVDNSNSNGPKQFDEIRVLPVYKHMFSVSTYRDPYRFPIRYNNSYLSYNYYNELSKNMKYDNAH